MSVSKFIFFNIKKIAFFLFVILTNINAYTQDSNYINFQNKNQFQKIIQQNTPAILDSLRQTYAVAQKIKYTYGQAETLKNIGVYFYIQKNYDSALHYYSKATILLKNSLPTTVSISIYLNIGVVYFEQAKYKEAIKQYLKAKNEAATINDSVMMVKVLNNLANAEATAGNVQQALKTLDEAILWARKSNVTIPNILTTQASLLVKTGDTAKAINNYKKALALLENNANLKLKAITLNNYGNLLFATGNKKEAAVLHNQALQIFEQIGDTEGKLTILNQLANNAYTQGQYAKALSLYKQVAAQADDNLPLKESVYTNLVLVYKKTGDYKNAFETLTILNEVKDSIRGTEIRKAIDELKTANAVQQAEMKAEQITFKAEKEKLILSKRVAWLSIGLVLALCFAGVVIFLRQRQKWKAEQQKMESLRQKSELEIQLFRTQMNPHFFFNALYSIQNYMLNNNALQSSRYLGKFARLARAILEWNAQPFVSIEKEISILEDYLSLEQLRFDDKFSYKIECDEETATNYQIPTMILQPFIENAIIHGLSKISYTGNIQITIEPDEKASVLKVTIDDNGTGIVQQHTEEKNKKSGKQSMALMLTQKRLELLSEQHNNHFYFELKDKKQNYTSNTGVLVNIYLPLIEL